MLAPKRKGCLLISKAKASHPSLDCSFRKASMSHWEHSLVLVPGKSPRAFVLLCTGIPGVSAPPYTFWEWNRGRLSSKLCWSWLPSGAGFGKERGRQLGAATNSGLSVKSACNPQLETSSSPYSYEHICIPVCPCFLVWGLFFFFLTGTCP